MKREVTRWSVSLSSQFFFPLRSTYLPQQPILEHISPLLVP